MAGNSLIQALGLNTSPNALSLPPGSLVQASNTIIQRDNVIESIRGFKLYGDALPDGDDRIKQLLVYKNRILRHFSNILQFDSRVENTDDESTFESFTSQFIKGGQILGGDLQTIININVQDLQVGMSVTGTGIPALTTVNAIIKNTIVLSQAASGPQSAGTLFTFTGTTQVTEVEEGHRLRSAESNGNFYFTSAEGIRKMSATNADDFTTDPNFVTKAGGVKSLGATSELIITPGDTEGFLPQDSTVAYRTVWGIKDANNNLILGSPSERTVVYNPLLSLIIRDFMLMLQAVDNCAQNAGGGTINTYGYLQDNGVPFSTNAITLLSHIISFCSDLDNDIYAALPAVSSISWSSGVTTVTFASNPSTLSALDYVELTNVASDGFNGVYQILTVDHTAFTITYSLPLDPGPYSTGTGSARKVKYMAITPPTTPDIPTPDSQLVAIQSYLSSILIELQNEIAANITAVNVASFLSPLAITTTATVELNISIPSQVTSSHFLQVYRGDIAQAVDTTVLSDLTPDDEMRQIYEAFPTSAELTAGVITVVDNNPDAFRDPNTPLYTNPASGDGTAQGNELPPVALDIAKFKNVLFYANTRTLYRLFIDMLSAPGFLGGQIIDISIASPAVVTTDANHGLVTGDQIYIVNTDSVPIVAGLYSVTVTGSRTFTVPVNVTERGTQGTWINFLGDGIASASAVASTVITTTANHNLSTGDLVYVNVPNSTPVINGIYSATVTAARTFTIPVTVSIAGTTGYWTSRMVEFVSDSSSNIYKFIRGVQQVTTIAVGAQVLGSYSYVNSKYFLLNSGKNETQYYVWASVDNTGTDPLVSGKTGLKWNLLSTDTQAVATAKLRDALASRVADFSVTSSSFTITVVNNVAGVTTDAADVDTTWTIATPIDGRGEDTSTLQVLLSSSISPAVALDETSRSFVRVVNQNPSEVCYAYYLSSVADLPGKMLFEGRELSSPKFYAMASSVAFGQLFSPLLTPASSTHLTNTAANPTVVNTTTSHGLSSGDEVVLFFSNSSPIIDGLYTITFASSSTFTVPVNVTTAGTTGFYRTVEQVVAADNEVKPNRIYYSKLQQPEAVPLLNFLDVGSGDKAIWRIHAIRNSLFVFKEDGLFLISGETTPFTLQLFDESLVLKAWDTVDQGNNQLYCWTVQGIQIVSESGAELISRPIDVEILKLASFNYPNFPSLTWGIAYNSDNSYVVYTNASTDDEMATIGYRYSALTGTWTTIDKEATCGVINPEDDRMYLGMGDVPYMEQERKSFSREDYAGRENTLVLENGNYLQDGTVLRFADVDGIEAGDVLTQNQTLSVFTFNSLLQKLDADPSVAAVDIVSIATGVDALITTDLGTKSLGHNLTVGDSVFLVATNSYPVVDGTYIVATTPSSTTFTVEDLPTIQTGATAGRAKRSYYLNDAMEGGNDPRELLETLADILDTDPGTVGTDYASTIASKSGSISLISATDPAVLTSTSHGLTNDRVVVLDNTESVPVIDGTYAVTVINDNQFSVDVAVEIADSSGNGTFVSDLTDPRDIAACFNAITDLLNEDDGTSFRNYSHAPANILMEAVITEVNTFTNQVTLSDPLPFLQGDMTQFEAIATSFTYAPLTLGDPLGLKHMRDFTMMFSSKAFSNASVYFASDLNPAFVRQMFSGDGPGIFGFDPFGAGYFGGASNSVPFRTYIPRECQRCRYLVIKFVHRVAREKYSVYGITVTGEVGTSSRAYR